MALYVFCPKTLLITFCLFVCANLINLFCTRLFLNFKNMRRSFLIYIAMQSNMMLHNLLYRVLEDFLFCFP